MELICSALDWEIIKPTVANSRVSNCFGDLLYILYIIMVY